MKQANVGFQYIWILLAAGGLYGLCQSLINLLSTQSALPSSPHTLYCVLSESRSDINVKKGETS